MPKTNSLKEALRASAEAEPAASGSPDPGAQRRTRQIAAHFPEEVYRQLRVLCATEGRTGRECLAEALNDLFKKYGRPPIA